MRSLASLLACLGASCGSAPPPLADGWWRALPSDCVLGTDFAQRLAAERRTLVGDVAQPIWLPGDELTFGLELFDGDRVEAQWVVSLTVSGPSQGVGRMRDRGPEVLAPQATITASTRTPMPDGRVQHDAGSVKARCQDVRAVVTDLDGATIYDAESTVWDGLHQIGVHAFLMLDEQTFTARSRPLGGDGSEAKPLRHGVTDPWWLAPLLLKLFETFRANDALEDVLSKVADWPSLDDAVGFVFAPQYVVDCDDLRGVTPCRVPGLLTAVSPGACSLPFRVTIGASPVLFANFVVVPPTGALALTAGVVGMTGHRPSAPHRRFVLALLGVRRGAPTGVHEPAPQTPARVDRPGGRQ
jgi:hypothetical protein